jgi:undecaprenyl-diphosphatase
METIRERAGDAPEVREVADAGEAAMALSAARDVGTELVVVVGGDGSIRTAATFLAGSGATLGIVPTGTGNLFAAALGIPRSPAKAARHLLTGRVRAVDLGEVETGAGRCGFVVACGTGFDARVMALSSPRAKALFGIAACFAAALGAARTARGVITRISAHGEVREVVALATLVANAGELIPGVLGARVPIRPDDGVLDLIAVTGRTALDGTMGAISLLMEGSGPEPGTIRESHGAIRLRASRIRVDTQPAEPVEIDGDVVEGAGGWLDATVRPGAIQVIAGERDR